MQLRVAFLSVAVWTFVTASSDSCAFALDYPVVDTGQERCYDNRREIADPKPGEPFFGQDAQYHGHRPAYRDNEDGTVSDLVTRLMWQKDPGSKKTFAEAVAGASVCRTGGYDDWRLPTLKELQSLVDDTRSPDTTQSAAIDPVFSVTPIRNARGEIDYPDYWSSTTHQRMGRGEAAAYIAFGRGLGRMPGLGGGYELWDVHGAGSQRSDPKSGDPSRFPHGRGPQGDVIRIDNMVRPVRGGLARRGFDEHEGDTGKGGAAASRTRQGRAT